MVYSELYRKNRGLNLWLLIILAGVAVAAGLMVKVTGQSAGAGKAVAGLQEYTIVNVAPDRLGLFWRTDSSQKNWLAYGTSSNDISLKGYDVRDTQKTIGEYRLHYALLDGLSPDKEYFFRILSPEGNLVRGSGYFRAKTPKQSVSRSSLLPVYGSVLRSDGMPAEGAFVLLKLRNFYPLLALTKNRGDFLIPLNNLFMGDTLEAGTIKDNEIYQIEIIAANGISRITGNVKDAAPLKEKIVLGKNYDLTQMDVLGVENKADSIAKKPESEKEPAGSDTDLKLIYPRENSIIPGNKPLIKGKAAANTDIFVWVKSKKEISYRTVSDKDGQWQIIPNNSFLPGNYTIRAASNNDMKNNLYATRSFTIAKEGEQVLGEATESPTITVAATPTTSPPAITPTLTPLPTYSTLVTTTPTPPTTGITSNWMLGASALLIVVGGGLLLAF